MKNLYFSLSKPFTWLLRRTFLPTTMKMTVKFRRTPQRLMSARTPPWRYIALARINFYITLSYYHFVYTIFLSFYNRKLWVVNAGNRPKYGAKQLQSSRYNLYSKREAIIAITAAWGTDPGRRLKSAIRLSAISQTKIFNPLVVSTAVLT